MPLDGVGVDDAAGLGSAPYDDDGDSVVDTVTDSDVDDDSVVDDDSDVDAVGDGDAPNDDEPVRVTDPVGVHDGVPVGVTVTDPEPDDDDVHDAVIVTLTVGVADTVLVPLRVSDDVGVSVMDGVGDGDGCWNTNTVPDRPHPPPGHVPLVTTTTAPSARIAGVVYT